MFVVVARYRTDPAETGNVATLLVLLAKASRAEPGNRGYEVLTSTDGPDAFAIVEHYADRAAFEAHVASAHYNELAVARIRPLLLERVVEFYAEIPGSEA